MTDSPVEKWNEVIVNRELRMVELKKEIAELKKENEELRKRLEGK